MKQLVIALLFVALSAAATSEYRRFGDYWCRLWGTCEDPRRIPVDPNEYWLPRGVGVIAHGYDMARGPQPWWHLTNVMPNHATLDDIAQYNIRIANLWIRVNPFVSWEDSWEENMDLVWTHPDFDVLIIRFEHWGSVEEKCDGTKTLVWENEPTQEIVERLYEVYGNQKKIIIFQNWEADWQLHGVGCRGRDQCVAYSWWIEDCLDSWSVSDCCDDYKLSRGKYLRNLFNARQRAIRTTRLAHPFSKLKVYHAIEVNFYEDEWLTVARDVIPFMDEPPDFVSLSYWGKPPAHITDGLNYIEEHTGLPRHRIYVAELGRRELQPGQQYDRLITEGRLALDWGVPIVLIWHWKYFGNDPSQQNLALFDMETGLPRSGIQAITELNDEYR